MRDRLQEQLRNHPGKALAFLAEGQEENMDRKPSRDREPEEGLDEGPIEIALVGDLTDHESELTERLLNVPVNGECTLFIDSPGGSPYCAIALTTLIRLRGIRATGVVTGECSSATLWPFAACQRRIVTPYSVLLFHPMKWQSEEHVGLQEAAEWARHFGSLEKEMDRLLAELLNVDHAMLDQWINPGRYVSGREFAEAGLAEMVSLSAGPIDLSLTGSTSPDRSSGTGKNSVKSSNKNGTDKPKGSGLFVAVSAAARQPDKSGHES
jgi:ATP-dependent protease ClpP protease subunit